MNIVLIPYDGSDAAARALRFVTGRPVAHRPRQVHLLNAQPWPIAYGEYLSPGLDIRALRAAQLEQGRVTLEPAERALADSGIPFQSHIQVGGIGDVIVEQSQQLGCDQIVMGTRGMGGFKGLLLGSIATQVVHQTQIPVTLIR